MTPFYYALYLGKAPILTADGRKTGQYRVQYRKPVLSKANISAARGETNTTQFGEDVTYDRVLVMDDPLTAIDEHSVLWIDTVPMLAPDGTLDENASGEIKTPWDYVVKKVARSLNSVAIAVSKVKLDG